MDLKNNEDKWIPLKDVLEVIQSKDWKWYENLRFKYVDIRIDTRDMHCRIFDGDHNLATLDELKGAEQYNPK